LTGTVTPKLGFSPKVLHLPFRPLLLHFPRQLSWVIAHLIYFPVLCLACLLSILYGRPVALLMKRRSGNPTYVCSRDIKSLEKSPRKREVGRKRRRYIEISGYSLVGWGIIGVDDPVVIDHEFGHILAWLGPYTQNKLIFNLVPMMVAGMFLLPLVGLGELSLALSLLLVLAFSLMAFVRLFH